MEEQLTLFKTNNNATPKFFAFSIIKTRLITLPLDKPNLEGWAIIER